MNKIYEGDALSVLKTIPNNCIDCVMTSPPYWALRDYGMNGQLGLEDTFDKYVSNLLNIFAEIKRVLKSPGTCWVNLGDTYSGSCCGAGSTRLKGEGSGFQNVTDGFYATSDKEKYYEKLRVRLKKQTLPSKSLCMIPFRFAIGMGDRGWILRNTIIWHKNNCMPSSASDRFTIDFEYLFFFTKSKKYYFNQQFEPYKPDSLRRSKSSYNSGKNDIIKTFSSTNQQKWSNKIQHQKNYNNPYLSCQVRDNHDIHNYTYKFGRNMRTTWHINTKSFKGKHFAVYPEKLCVTPIKSGCPENGVVLDPFMGSGTTLVVAKKLARQYIGIELNPEYIKIAKQRLNEIEQPLITY